MTTADVRKITDTVHYCLNHCDSDEETRMIEWMGEHLLDSISRNQPNLDVSPLWQEVYRHPSRLARQRVSAV